VAEILREAVGNVDGGVREAAQPLAELDARLGLVQALRGCRVARLLERERGAAQLARDPDVIARPRTAAHQREARGHLAEDGDAQGERPARGIAAHEVDIESSRERVEAFGEGGDPRFVCRRQRDRERRPARRGAHCRHVGKVDRERLVPQQPRIRAFREVPALQQQVGGYRELRPRVGPQQRGVVAHAEQRVARRPRKVPLDDLEFGRHRRP
jgi:hypothetical protein